MSDKPVQKSISESEQAQHSEKKKRQDEAEVKRLGEMLAAKKLTQEEHDARVAAVGGKPTGKQAEGAPVPPAHGTAPALPVDQHSAPAAAPVPA